MRRWRSKSGQATVEMAIVAPILILLVIGLVEIARIASVQLTLEHAVRETVRLGITGANDADLAARAQATATSLDKTKLTVVITPAGTRTSGQDVSVKLTYAYKVMALSKILGAQFSLQSQLMARVE